MQNVGYMNVASKSDIKFLKHYVQVKPGFSNCGTRTTTDKSISVYWYVTYNKQKYTENKNFNK